jgi:hypothetical protein
VEQDSLTGNTMFVFRTAHKKQAGAVVSRLWLGSFAGRDELGDVNDYGQIILHRETKHEDVD